MGKRGPQPRPEARKVAKGLRLSPAAWDRLEEIATERGTTQTLVLEELIMNNTAQQKAISEVSRRVADVCGSEAGETETNAVIERFGVNLAGVSDREIWDAATGGAEWPF